MNLGSYMGMLEDAEAAAAAAFKSEGGAGGLGGLAVPKSPPGSSTSYWSSSSSGGESFYGGSSTPPGLMSDSSFAETESSEDDDFVAGLAEQMAHSMLDDDDNIGTSEVDSVDRTSLWGESCWNPAQFMTSSAIETEHKHNWSAGCWSSGYSSSSSKVSSPPSPSTPGGAEDGWDAVAGNDAGGGFTVDGGGGGGGYLPEVHWRSNAFSDVSRNGAGGLPVLTKPYAAAVNPSKGWNLKEDDRRPPTQCRSSNQSPVGVWNRQSRCHPQHQQQCLPARSTYRCTGTQQRPLGPPWQGPPPPSGSVMRAVFLGGSADRSSTGTGVFLPRSSNDYSKRKTSCSSVLLPSRIVQVLNLNVDDMRCQPLVQSGGQIGPGNGSSAGNGGGSDSLNGPADEVWSSNSQWKTYTYCAQLHQPAESTLPTEWSY